MKLTVWLIALLLAAQILPAQNKVTGKVVDAMNRQPLQDATITIINPGDSAAVGFAIADKTGLFEIKNLKKGSFILGVSYTGYREFIKNLDISLSQFVINLDTIFLFQNTSMLQSVIIS